MSGRDKDVVWEHGENLYPGWRCNYCNTQKGGGGATRLKQHLAGREAEVVHCRNVLRVRGIALMSTAEYQMTSQMGVFSFVR